MNSLLLHLIQTTFVFSVLYILYIVFLDKLTFHNVNRVVLLLLLPVSSIIPFSSHVFPTLSSKIIEVPLFEHVTIGTINQQLQVIEQPLVNSSMDYSIVLIFIYWLVFSIYVIRILINARHLLVLKNNSIVQQKNGYQLVAANVPEIFSYFHWVFIPKDTLEPFDPQILEHERVHIQLKHSWDVILTEVYLAFFWFNPLLYLYRKSLKSVHEFQADKGVLNSGIKTSQYMQLLLQCIEVQKPNNLYNYFNQPLLKKRIIMMTKPKSNGLAKLKYILLLPACAFLISAFTSPSIENSTYLNIINVPEILNEAPSLFPVENASKKDITSFYGEKSKRPKTKTNKTHSGIDIRAKIGTPVIASADGIISKAAMEGDWGNLIVITHADGYETWYAHLKGFHIRENQEVKKGDVIGYVGNTGLSTGPHLHYEVKHNGQHVNPMDYME